MRELADRVAVATGAASGIGRPRARGVSEGRFYLLPGPELKAGVERRLRDILEDRVPELRMPGEGS